MARRSTRRRVPRVLTRQRSNHRISMATIAHRRAGRAAAHIVHPRAELGSPASEPTVETAEARLEWRHPDLARAVASVWAWWRPSRDGPEFGFPGTRRAATSPGGQVSHERQLWPQI